MREICGTPISSRMNWSVGEHVMASKENHHNMALHQVFFLFMMLFGLDKGLAEIFVGFVFSSSTLAKTSAALRKFGMA